MRPSAAPLVPTRTTAAAARPVFRYEIHDAALGHARGDPATLGLRRARHDEAQPSSEVLDEAGRVTRHIMADGREITVLMARDPFTYQAPASPLQATSA